MTQNNAVRFRKFLTKLVLVALIPSFAFIDISQAFRSHIGLVLAVWGQQSYIKAGNVDAGDNFGSVIAIDGDTLVVGAPNEQSNQTTITNGTGSSADDSTSNAGAVYVYRRSGQTWTQEAYLKGSGPNGVIFGGSVAISGDTIVVGAEYDPNSLATIHNSSTGPSVPGFVGSNGALYVFRRSGVTWSQEAYIKSNVAKVDQRLGANVAIDGDVIVASAPGDKSTSTTIVNSGGAASNNTSGSSVGAVYVFRRTGTNWAQEAYIKPTNPSTDLRFGGDGGTGGVAISGMTIAVGVPYEDSNQSTITTTASSNTTAPSSGAVYIYKYSSGLWALEAYVKASNRMDWSQFGFSVSLSGDDLAVGSPVEGSSLAGINNTATATGTYVAFDYGAAYTYSRSGSTWTQTAYFKPPNPHTGRFFGQSVVIEGSRLVVGADGDKSNQTFIVNGTTASADTSFSSAGAAYVFVKSNDGLWMQDAYIKADNNAADRYFGRTVDLSGNTVVVGAKGDASNQTTITNGPVSSTNATLTNAGAVHVFTK